VTDLYKLSTICWHCSCRCRRSKGSALRESCEKRKQNHTRINVGDGFLRGLCRSLPRSHLLSGGLAFSPWPRCPSPATPCLLWQRRTIISRHPSSSRKRRHARVDGFQPSVTYWRCVWRLFLLSTPKMEAVYSSEMWLPFYKTIQSHVLENNDCAHKDSLREPKHLTDVTMLGQGIRLPNNSLNIRHIETIPN
jgi:hypothetical protein